MGISILSITQIGIDAEALMAAANKVFQKTQVDPDVKALGDAVNKFMGDFGLPLVMMPK